MKTQTMQKHMAQILIVGTILSLLLVLVGGIFSLIQRGSETLPYTLTQIAPYYSASLSQIISEALKNEALGLITLGLLILVATQIIRILYLAGFYLFSRDYRFAAFSVFILLTLLYSAVFKN